MNYRDRAGIVHEGEPGLEEASATEALMEAGWAVQVRVRCAVRILVNQVVEEPVTCLSCLAQTC
jgi:hypothetical protein